MRFFLLYVDDRNVSFRLAGRYALCIMIKRAHKTLLLGGGWLVGIVVGSLFFFQWWFILMMVFIMLVGWFSRAILFFVLVVVMILGGFLLVKLSYPTYDEGFIAYYNEQKVTFKGMVREPDVRVDHIKLTIESSHIKQADQWLEVTGLVLVKAPLYPEYAYGDIVEVTCTLRAPEPIDDFHYERYLARYNIYSLCYHPRIIIRDQKKGGFIMEWVLVSKDAISQVINKTIPEPQAAFLAGILLGSRKGIPQDLIAGFNRTGITHIIAISGYNITIISVMLLNMCLAFGLNRKQAFYIIVIGVIFFTIITGASAAVVRSAIMGILVLVATHSGRKSNIGVTLMVTAVVMVMVNPKILLDDAGFQLSFIATMGLIYGVPVLEPLFKWVTPRFGLQENITTTSAAIIATTPLILYQFGRFSIAALFVNVSILFIIPIAMAIGFIQVVVGFLSTTGGQFISWLTWLLLTYIIKIVEWVSPWQFASIEVSISIVTMISLYILLILISYIYHQRRGVNYQGPRSK